MRFVLTVPLPPNRANARGHWSVHHRMQRRYWKYLDEIQALAHNGFSVPRPPREPLDHAHATAVLYVWAEMDEGNALNRIKWLEDWLVTRGYLVDDKRRNLHWAGIPKQIIDRKRMRVELTLEAA